MDLNTLYRTVIMDNYKNPKNKGVSHICEEILAHHIDIVIKSHEVRSYYSKT